MLIGIDINWPCTPRIVMYSDIDETPGDSASIHTLSRSDVSLMTNDGPADPRNLSRERDEEKATMGFLKTPPHPLTYSSSQNNASRSATIGC